MFVGGGEHVCVLRALGRHVSGGEGGGERSVCWGGRGMVGAGRKCVCGSEGGGGGEYMLTEGRGGGGGGRGGGRGGVVRLAGWFACSGDKPRARRAAAREEE